MKPLALRVRAGHLSHSPGRARRVHRGVCVAAASRISAAWFHSSGLRAPCSLSRLLSRYGAARRI
eukprot:29616-Prymnesium_polylepis.2